MTEPYRYQASTKSESSDELINTVLLRPLAAVIVRILYRTPVTPNQVTLASTFAGLFAALAYTYDSVIAAGLLVTLKDLLDSADGQLARAKNLYSRRGRFLDSIGDFVVNLAVFSALGWILAQKTQSSLPWLWAFFGLAGITLRVSYHVFYQTSFLHLGGAYQANRLTEEITAEDLAGDRLALILQKIFLGIYGWQDRLMVALDAWCCKGRFDEEFRRRWYSDPAGLRLSGLLGMGTELFLLMLCSVSGNLEGYFWLNIAGMNAILLASVAYRRHLAGRLAQGLN